MREEGRREEDVPSAVPQPSEAKRAVRRKHDEFYKLFFSQRQAFEELIRGFVVPEGAEALDFASAEKLSAEHVTSGLAKRLGDLLWKVPFREDPGLCVLFPVEFQSRFDRRAGGRIVAYAALAYDDVVPRGKPGPDRARPLVVPLVVYNGRRRWDEAEEAASGKAVERAEGLAPALAAWDVVPRYFVLDMQACRRRDLPKPNVVSSLAELEGDPSLENAIRVAREVAPRLRVPGSAGLREAFGAWFLEFEREWGAGKMCCRQWRRS